MAQHDDPDQHDTPRPTEAKLELKMGMLSGAAYIEQQRTTDEYNRGYGHAVWHQTTPLAGQAAPGCNYRDNHETPGEWKRGYDEAMLKLTGGHSERYAKDEVLVHRETVEQLVDAIELLVKQDDRGNDVHRDLANILPNLKRALHS